MVAGLALLPAFANVIGLGLYSAFMPFLQVADSWGWSCVDHEGQALVHMDNMYKGFYAAMPLLWAFTLEFLVMRITILPLAQAHNGRLTFFLWRQLTTFTAWLVGTGLMSFMAHLDVASAALFVSS